MNKNDMRHKLKVFLLNNLEDEKTIKEEKALKEIGAVLRYNQKYLECISFGEMWEIVEMFNCFLYGGWTSEDLRQEINTMLRYYD
jgi:hypothetical protein